MEANMIHTFSTAAAIILISATAALAQTATAPTSSKVATDTEGKSLVGAPLSFNPSAEGGNEGKPDTLFVIETGSVKSAAEWSEADRNACKASGGIELPVSAGRIACFAL